MWVRAWVCAGCRVQHIRFNRLHGEPAGQSMDHHFLTSYHHAIMSTILAQFNNQGFLDGMEGIVKLVEISPYLQVCLLVVMINALAAVQLTL